MELKQAITFFKGRGKYWQRSPRSSRIIKLLKGKAKNIKDPSIRYFLLSDIDILNLVQSNIEENNKRALHLGRSLEAISEKLDDLDKRINTLEKK